MGAPVVQAYEIARRGKGQIYVTGSIDAGAAPGTRVGLEFYRLSGASQKLLGRLEVVQASGATPFAGVLDAKLSGGQLLVARSTGNFETAGAESLPVSVLAGGDGDRDGIPDAIEGLGPRQGDANADGIPDRLQRTIANIPSPENGNFLTLNGKGRPLANVAAERRPAAAAQDLPYGLLNFEVREVSPGAIVQVQITLPEGASPGVYYKHDPATGQLSPFTFNGSTGALFNGNTVTLYLQDGGRGDADGVANGVIVDPGGPGGDVLRLVCTSHDSTEGWTVAESGGSAEGRGGVEVIEGDLVLREGDSFLVTAEQPVVIPGNPGTLVIDFLESFDLTDRQRINDALEIALVDEKGLPVVPVARPHSDAFFNFTEDEDPTPAPLDSPVGRTVELDISSLPPGATYRLILRLVNNDTDTTSIVTVGCSHSPTAFDDAYTMDEDAVLTIGAATGVLANDTDPDNDSLKAIPVTSPAHGVLNLLDDGSFTYAPEPNFAGVDTFTYKASDAFYDSNVATVTITVSPVDDPPLAVNDQYDVLQDGGLNVPAPGVLENDLEFDGQPISAQQLTDPAHGAATLNADGSFTYTPDPGYVGTDSFTYLASDGLLDSAPATITLHVLDFNDPPAAVDDEYEVAEDTILTVGQNLGVLANDTDPENDSLEAFKLTDPANGAVTLYPDGSFTFQPHPDWNGATTFTYRVFDGMLYSEPATVTLTVTPLNDPPTANDDEYTILEDAVLSPGALTGVLANDSDVDIGDTLAAEKVTDPVHGALVLNSDGSFTYTPDAEFYGDDSFTYRVSDGSLYSQAATVVIHVTEVNDPPAAVNDAYSVNEDSSLSIGLETGVLANDYDVEGHSLTATLVNGPSHGYLWLEEDGSFSYWPDPDFFGQDAFTYKAYDGNSLSAAATVTIQVNNVNDPPEGYEDWYDVNEDSQLVVNAAAGVLANDTDIDNDVLEAVLLQGPQHGGLELNADGSFTYTPNPNFDQTDSFTYRAFDGQAYSSPVTVMIYVYGINDAPQAVDDYYTTPEDTLLAVSVPGVLANDYDPDGDSLTPELLSEPTHGVLTWNYNGSFSYEPDLNFTGDDTFTYQLYDGSDGSLTATVTIHVLSVNDPPTGVADSYSTLEDTVLSKDDAEGVLANDTDDDNDPLTAVLVRGALHGTVDLEPDGSFTYTPHQDYYGSDSFIYRADDGTAQSLDTTVSITVQAVNDAPVAVNDNYAVNEDASLSVPASVGVLANDTDVDSASLTAVLVSGVSHGALNLQSNGSFTYTPAANYFGDDTFTYQAYDGAEYSQIATVTITVNPVNDAPQAVGDAYATDEDTPLAVEAPGVLGNDTDIDGPALSAVLRSGPQHGTLQWGGDGSFIYTPAPNYYGPDAFTYQASDGLLQSNLVTVAITVNAVNDAPIAANDAYQVDEDGILDVAVAQGVLANDTDVDGPNLTAVKLSDPQHGALTFNADGSFEYIPDPDYFSTDFFTYYATDGLLDSSAATVTITVNGVNDPPLAVDDHYSVQEDQTLTVSPAGVLANDSDVEGSPLTATRLAGPSHGALVFNSDGSFTYTPGANFFGTDTFTYQANDGQLPSGVATVTITVSGVNDAPTAVDDALETDQYTSVTFSAAELLANDSDVEGDPLSVVDLTSPAHGTLVDNRNGSWTYTPTGDYVGIDAFEYTISDGAGGTDTATVTITVRAIAGAKFFVPNLNRGGDTYRYNGGGDYLNHTPLEQFNSSPRGTTSTAARDLVWIIDGRHGVFIYRSDGSFVGRWADEGLNQPEGIATDGTHLWIVDNASDVVYYYEDAATYHGSENSKRPGSASPTSSFPLAPGNQNPYGMTSDGSTIWIVDRFNGVFVYGAAGTLLGNWSIDSENVDPTGITLNPAGGADLWIVDRHQDRVFYYAGAMAWLEGSHSATSVFALHNKNDHPMGIADPPVVAIHDPAVNQRSLAGSPILITGTATPAPLAVSRVAVNETTASVVDAAGNFFSAATVSPGNNVFEVTATDTANASTTQQVQINGVSHSERTPDFSRVAAAAGVGVIAEYGYTTFTEHEDLLRAQATLVNQGTFPVRGPLLVGVRNISSPLVVLSGHDGVTPDGIRYYDLSSLAPGGTLAPGESTDSFVLEFYNPTRTPFSYELVVFGAANMSPRFITPPVVQVVAGKNYTYPSQGFDEESDPLTYQRVSGPAGLAVHSQTGAVAWATTANDVGDHWVKVRVDDDHGGFDEQVYLLSVLPPDTPNRPPRFTSAPIVDAYVNVPYGYQATAFDPDSDELDFFAVSGPSGFTIPDSAGGLTHWIPTEDLVDQLVSVALRVEDGRGGFSEQEYQVYVHPQPGNHDPIIISEPGTQFTIPNLETNPPLGDVNPQLLHLDLGLGDEGVAVVTLTLPGSELRATADVIVLMDVSGSMGTEWTWSGDMAAQLAAELENRGITANRFALVGFTFAAEYFTTAPLPDTTIPVAIYGPDDELYRTTALLSSSSHTLLVDFDLPESGEYLLAINDEGSEYSGPGENLTYPLPYSFYLQTLPEATNDFALTLNALTLGELATAGQRDRYSFTLASDTRLLFDSLTNRSDMQWSLSGPSGELVANRAFNSGGSVNADLLLEAPAGDYTLTVSAAALYPDDYRFQLLDLSTAGAYLGATELAAPVAGQLGPAKETDVFRFDAAAGDRFFFDVTEFTVGESGRWRLLDPYGQVVFSQSLFASIDSELGPDPITGNDQPTMTLPATGEYTLLVEGAIGNSDAAAGYQFQIYPETLVNESLLVGDVVSGALSQPGEVIRYAFSLSAPASLYFDIQAGPGFGYGFGDEASYRWSLDGPPGRLVNERAFNSTDEFTFAPNGEELLLDVPAGSYTLTIDAASDLTENYAFRLFDVFAQSASLSMDTPQTATLSPAAETDGYRFSADAGDSVIFDKQAWSGSASARWRLIGPYGQSLFDASLNSDQGPLTLPSDGDYVLLVVGDNWDTSANPSYTIEAQFQGNTPPPAISGSALTLNQTTSGSLASTSEVDSYTFTLAASTLLYFDSLTNSSTMRWLLRGPAGTVVNNLPLDQTDNSYYTSHPALFNLPAGDYQLDVSTSFETGNYSFRLVEPAAVATALTPGTAVNETLDPANESHFYEFDATAGDRFYFDFSAGASEPTAWRLIDPYGREMFVPEYEPGYGGAQFGDKDVTALPASGTYTLIVEGAIGEQDPSSYMINVQPETVTSASLTLGATASGSLDLPGERDEFTFTLAADSFLYFDSLANSSLRWSLAGPSGTLVSNRLFTQSDASSVSDAAVVIDAPAGNYTLSVVDPSGATGSYSFNLLDLAASASPLTLAAAATATLSPARQTQVRSFSAEAGDRLYFDSQEWTSSGSARWRLVDPYGRVVFQKALSADQATLDLPASGQYLLLIEGAVADGTASADFTFLVQPETVVASTFTVNDLASGELQTPGERHEYAFTLAGDSLLYFDSRTDATFDMETYSNVGPRWTLTGPSGAVVVDRGFEESDAATVSDEDVLLDLPVGEYTLTVSGPGDFTGGYEFRLVDLASSHTPITPGESFTGALAPARETDVYQFTADAGDKVSLDSISWSGSSSARWRLVDPFGNIKQSTALGSDAAAVTLWAAGTYTLLVEGAISDTAASRSYTLNVVPAGSDTLPPDGDSLTLGETVSGDISTAGEIDVFSFAGQKWQRLYFDSLDEGASPNLNVRLEGPSGSVVFSGYSTQNFGPVTLHEVGTHRLVVSGTGSNTGPYSFRLLDAGAQPAVALDEPQTGEIEVEGLQDLLLLSGQAGDRFALRMHAWTDVPGFQSETSRLVVLNGLEDGYFAVDSAFNQLPLRDNVPVHVLLVSDEDRVVTAQQLTYNSTLDDLMDHGARLHSLINAAIDVGQQSGALGLDGLTAQERAFFLDGSGGYTVAPSGDVVFTPRGVAGGENIVPFDDYGLLALDTGGTVWDLGPIRQQGTARESFSKALVEAIAGQVEEQVAIDVIPSDPSISVEIVSQTGADNERTFQLRFYGDGQPHSFDLFFVRASDHNVVLGSVPVTVRTTYRYDVDAIDPDEDDLTYHLVGETHGAIIDAVTGLMSWGPAAEGAYPFTAKVTDGRGGSDTQTWTVTVGITGANNAPPVIDPLGIIAAEAARPVTAQVEASDPDEDQLRYLLIDDPAGGAPLPQGVSIDSMTGRIDWTPTTDQVGQFPIKVRVIDGQGGQDTEIAVTFDVALPAAFQNRRPDILSSPPTSALAGKTYRYDVRATDPDNDELTYELPAAPPGMTIHPKLGVIAWSPQREHLGNHSVIVRVRDDFGGVALQPYTLAVTEINSPPAITSTPQVPAGVNVVWSYPVKATDPNGDVLKYALDALSLAREMSIDQNTGLVTWTATAVGDYHVRVTADDQRGGTSTQEFVLPVRANAPPQIISTPGYPAIVGQEYVYTVVAVDPNSSDVLTLTLDDSSLARGMTRTIVACPLPEPQPNCIAAALRWTPTSLGDLEFTVIVADQDQATDGQTFKLPVQGVPLPSNPPEITSVPTGPAYVGEAWTYPLAGFDPDGDDFGFSLDDGPAGMDILNGVVTWTPSVVSSGELVTVRIAEIAEPDSYATQSFYLPAVEVPTTNEPPQIVSIPTGPAVVGEYYEYQVVAVDPEQDDLTFSFVTSNDTEFSVLPHFDEANRLMTWVPDAVGDITVQITATDTAQNYFVQEFTLYVVAPPNNPPRIRSAPVGPAYTGETWTYVVEGDDPDVGDTVTFSFSYGGSENVIWDGEDTVTWVPSAAETEITATVTAEDGRGGWFSQMFTVSAIDRPANNDAPAFTSTPRGPAKVNRLWTYQAHATDPNGDELTYSLDAASLARGMTIEVDNGWIEWTSDTAGNYPVTVTADDGNGGSAWQAFTLSVVPVNAPPKITSAPSGPAYVSHEWEYRLTATDPDNDVVSFYLDPNEADHGASLPSGSDTLTWTPAAIGDYTFHVVADDGKGGTYTQIFTIEARAAEEFPVNHAPVFVSIPVTPIRLGQVYLYDADAFDPNGDPLEYSLDAAPVGMAIDRQTGLVTWSPTTTGQFLVTILAADDEPLQTPQSYVLEVLPPVQPNRPPVITSDPARPAVRDRQYQYQVVATDPDPDTLHYSLEIAPAGMDIDPDTGLITWLPAAGGAVEVKVVVTDGLLSYWQQYTLPVLENAPPVITSTPGQYVNLGELYQYPVVAEDPNPGDTIIYDLVRFETLAGAEPQTLPAINPQSGLLEWTPDAAGLYRVTVSAADQEGLTDEQVYELLVTDPNAQNQPPEITNAPRDTLQIGQTLAHQFEAVDPEEDRPLTFLLVSAPTGLTMTDTGFVQWTPAAGQVNDPASPHSLVVTVVDHRGAGNQYTFYLNVTHEFVNHAPAITSSPKLGAVAGTTYFYQATATDEDQDLLSWSFDQVPAGMAVGTYSGLVTWAVTPQNVGKYTVKLRVTDVNGAYDVQEYELEVRGANRPATITSDPPTDARVGVQYVYNVVGEDPDGDPIKYSLDPNYLPDDIAIDAVTGRLTWTPSQEGVTRFIVRAVDQPFGWGVQQIVDAVVTVAGANEPPQITSTPKLTADAGAVYQYDVDASDPEGQLDDFTLLIPDPLPAGMTFNPQSGLLEWTPSQAQIGQEVQFKVQASDIGGLNAWQWWSVVVLAPNHPPQFDSDPVEAVTAGRTYLYGVRAKDDDNDKLTYKLLEGPAGMEIDKDLGIVTWPTTLDDIGSYPVRVSVTDGRSAPIEQPYTLVVTEDELGPTVALVFLPSSTVDVGESVTILVLASDDVGIASRTLSVDGQNVALDAQHRATVSFDAAATIAVSATATDTSGLSGSASGSIEVRGPDGGIDPQNAPPQVGITAPADRAVITAPIDVLANITDAEGDLVRYTLSFAPFDGSAPFKVIRTVQAAPNETLANLSGAVVGRFDPTILANGPYILRLEAEDANEGVSAIEQTINVAGRLKLGNFTVSFTDITIPVAGIPITITRTYDTLRANKQGDFGYGWSLDVKDAKLEVDDATLGGRGWGAYRAFETGTRVTVTLADGRTEGFTFEPVPNETVLGIVRNYKPAFRPDPRNTTRLFVPPVAIEKSTGEWQAIMPQGLVTYNPQDPIFGAEYTLIDEFSGMLRTIDADTGDVKSLEDRNGNRLSISKDGITSNSGRKVDFTRDFRGRVTKITDPRGNSLVYEYDSHGDLVSVTDRTGEATTRFSYFPDPEHYLASVSDPYDRTVLRAHYTDDGRLDGLTNAHGDHTTARYHITTLSESVTDPFGNEKTVVYDAQGNEVKTIDFDGSATLRQFDSAGRVTGSTLVVGLPDNASNEESDDVTTVFSYGLSGAMTYTDALGNVTRFAGNEAGQPTSITDALGNSAQYIYGPPKQFPDGTPWGGDLIGIVDPAGTAKYFLRDSQGNMSSYTVDIDHNTFSRYDMETGGYYEQNYDPNCTEDDPACRPLDRPELPKASFQHNEYGDLISSTSPAGVSSTIGRDANGNRESTTTVWINPDDSNDERTIEYTHVFDAEDRITLSTSPEGTETITYDLLGHKVKTATASGRSSTIFDSRRQAVQLTQANGFVQRIVYDAQGRVIWETDFQPPEAPTNGTRTYYDELGRQTRQERFANVVIDLVRLNDGSYRSTFVSSSPNPLWMTENVYNVDGTLQSTTNAEGLTTTFEYDKLGQQLASVQVVNGVTIRTEMEYDAAGNRVLDRDALGRETRHVYDSAGREVKTVFPNGTAVEMTYTRRGALASRTDELGKTTDFKYDASGNLTSVTLPAVIDPATQAEVRPKWEYGYDEYNDLRSIRDPLDREQHFDFDERGRQTAWTLPDVTGKPVATESRTYDSRGRLETVTDFKGQITVNHYDALGRMTLVEYFASAVDRAAGQPAETIVYAYDAFDETGRRHETVTDLSGVTDYAYNLENRLVSIASPEGTIHYEYSPAGRVTRTYTENSDVSYSYDARGLLASVTAAVQLGVTLAAPEVTTYTRDALGNVIETVFPNGVVTHVEYDALNRPQYVEHRTSGGALLGSYYYVTDPAGKILSVFDDRTKADVEAALAAGQADALARTEYDYDGLDRLIQELHFEVGQANPFHSAAYEWDLVSNLLRKSVTTATGDAETNNYRYNARDQIIDEVFRLNGAEQWTVLYDYDANGSLIARTRPDKSETFDYSVRGRLQAASIVETIGEEPKTTETSYLYDHNGIRTQKTITITDLNGPSPETTLYLNDPLSPYGFSRVLEEWTPGGVIKASFVHGPTPISQSRPEGTNFYLSDAHSGVRLLVDASDVVTSSFRYSAFGGLLSSSGSTPNYLLYRGEQFDAELENYYLRARYYEPSATRFHGTDPLLGVHSNPVTLHKYLYAGGDPIQFIDPTGKSLISANMAALGMQISGQAAKLSADMQQKKRIEGSRLGQLASWMMVFNLYVVEAEERTLLPYLAFASNYNIELASMAPFNAAAYFENSAGKMREFLRFAMNYSTNQLLSSNGLVLLKSNGLPNFTAILTQHVPGSVVFLLLTGDHTQDVIMAKALSGLGALSGLLYRWHHHEVVGIMMAVLVPFHKAAHIGGRNFYSIAQGVEYKNTPPWLL